MKPPRRSHTCTLKLPSSSSDLNEENHSSPSPLASPSWSYFRSALVVVASSSSSESSSSSSSRRRGHLKSPWSRRKKKNALTRQVWRSSFTPDGKLCDGGIKLLKIIRGGGIDPSIRYEVWPFLLGVYDLNSTKEERDILRNKNRREYERFRRQCRRLQEVNENTKKKESGGTFCSGYSNSPSMEPSLSGSEDFVSARESLSSERESTDCEYSEKNSNALLDETNSSQHVTNSTSSVINTDSSDSELSEDNNFDEASPLHEQGNVSDVTLDKACLPSKTNPQQPAACRSEDFATWQRIIRLDAVRANAEWIPHSPSLAAVSGDRAHRSAKAVGLKDYEHLEPCRVYHAARLVAILEAYAVYDTEIGYCQGMSDLLSPLISVIEQDHMAFWCFVGFMKRARHNFRLDEVGIRRQLDIVAKIIKYKDSQLYKHLVKLQAEDCFFVYRMVVVLFRRELSFQQTLCLWEVMWANQTALRAGLGKPTLGRIRQRAPPTEDLLLYAIAASVLQRRKLIIEKYSSMDEILRECNNMAGQLDIWKLLDDAHNLITTLHDKIEASL